MNMNDLVFRIHEEDIFQAQLQKKADYVEYFTKRLKGLEAYFEIGIGPMEHFKHGFDFTPITRGFPIMQHINTRDLNSQERASIQDIHDTSKYMIPNC